MKCIYCNQNLPDDSEFCQFCGKKIEKINLENFSDEQVVKTGNTNSAIDSSSGRSGFITQESPKGIAKWCNVVGRVLNNKNGEHHSYSKINLKSKPIVFMVVGLLLLLVLSVGINIYQYSTHQTKTVEMNDKISSLENTISSQKSTIALLTGQVETKENKANLYDNLISELSIGNFGYASRNFCSSESVIVVSKNQKNRKFLLTANWSDGGSVSTSYSPVFPTARVSFDDDEWKTSTTMTVEPYSTGITTVTFSNNVDNNSFKIIIIVTD